MKKLVSRQVKYTFLLVDVSWYAYMLLVACLRRATTQITVSCVDVETKRFRWLVGSRCYDCHVRHFLWQLAALFEQSLRSMTRNFPTGN